jgi:hypothetical protein
MCLLKIKKKMTPQDVQNNFNQCVLYYIFNEGDSNVYSRDLVDVGVKSYDFQTGEYYMSDWYLETCDIPTNTTLATYSLQDVLDHYNLVYQWPLDISGAFENSFARLTTTQLNSAQLGPAYYNVMAFDTTAGVLKRYTSQGWTTDLF